MKIIDREGFALLHSASNTLYNLQQLIGPELKQKYGDHLKELVKNIDKYKRNTQMVE